LIVAVEVNGVVGIVDDVGLVDDVGIVVDIDTVDVIFDIRLPTTTGNNLSIYSFTLFLLKILKMFDSFFKNLHFVVFSFGFFLAQKLLAHFTNS